MRASGRVSSSERGETLVETLITMALMSVIVLGLLAGLAAVSKLVSHNNRVTNASNTAQSYAEQLKQPVDDHVASMEYRSCVDGPVDYPAFTGQVPSAAYTVEIDEVQFASALTGGGSPAVTWSPDCPSQDLGLQLITVEVTVTRGSRSLTETVAIVKRDARCDYSVDYENLDLGPC